jgi:hypothetical protein
LRQPVGIDLERDPHACGSGDRRWNARQLETRKRATVADNLALALHDMPARIAVWPSLKVGELLRRAVGIVLLRGMMRSTGPPIVSSSERQRDHVEQQQLGRCRHCRPARWPDRRAERDHFVGVQVVQRRPCRRNSPTAR